ncbi:hypothetical protein M2322_004681, partial [Rhodoblastus acidophilus]|uniref:hypothetical protein n=1 Tax=Rhodoblastus acidophilus TaxID=1074 RepID=UPI0022255AFF
MARACDDLSDPTISFGDNITIRNISDLKDDLLGDLTLAGRLTLVIDDDALVDLSGVQLIVAAQAFARREGKALRLARPAGGN